MPPLLWELSDAFERGVMTLTLPVTNSTARALRRGEPSPPLPVVSINDDGQTGDLLLLGFESLFAVSPRLSRALDGFSGIAFRDLAFTDPRLKGFRLLGVRGRC